MQKPVMKAPEAPKGEFTKQLITEGLVDAKCYAVIDKGSYESEYQGKKSMKRKIQISFETQQMGKFIDKDTKEEKELPLTVHLTKAFSFYEQSRLYPLLKDWVNIDEIKKNVFDLVGKTAKLMVSHTTNDDGNIYTEILKIKPGEKDWKLINQEVYFSLDSFNEEEWMKLSEKNREKISTTPEYKEVLKKKESEMPF